jgi:bacteriocin-like protein
MTAADFKELTEIQLDQVTGGKGGGDGAPGEPDQGNLDQGSHDDPITDPDLP